MIKRERKLQERKCVCVCVCVCACVKERERDRETEKEKKNYLHSLSFVGKIAHSSESGMTYLSTLSTLALNGTEHIRY